jgi:FAD/FMN-containing dehydrogenase
MTVQAGAILQNVQEQAEEHGWHFALDLGARGSATIGGNISTNAGGNSVVRYGMMREQVLGLEAVLADGTVLTSMNSMLKNNAGYDLKQLFIGSEGTLGIVTRAVLRLRPLQGAVQTALVALNNFADVGALLRRLGVELEGKLNSFEVMWNSHYRLLAEESGRHQAFLPVDYPYYVLVESCGNDQAREEEHFTGVFGALLEQEAIADAVIAQSGQQADQLWEMRDDIEALVLALYPIIPFDISLPIRDMESYVANVESEIKRRWPGTRVVTFGHLGDGNIHLGIGPVEDEYAVQSVVYQHLAEVGGSISAEHGIGLEKKPFLSCSRNEAEIALMKTLKSALDPKNILNPGKIISTET